MARGWTVPVLWLGEVVFLPVVQTGSGIRCAGDQRRGQLDKRLGEDLDLLYNEVALVCAVKASGLDVPDGFRRNLIL